MVTIKQIQEQLNKLGYKVTVDGIRGKQTTAAVIQFQKDNGLFPDGIVGAKTEAKLFESCPTAPKLKILTTKEKTARYGKAGDYKNFDRITPPFPMKLAWDTKTIIKSFVVNKYIETRMSNVFDDILYEYGRSKISALGIDLYGGCFNHRPMRGTEVRYANAIRAKNYALAETYLSSHSWAIAIDLDPARNMLRETSKTARFARPEYKPMIDCFYRHGFVSYGVEKGFDFMHFEIGS